MTMPGSTVGDSPRVASGGGSASGPQPAVNEKSRHEITGVTNRLRIGLFLYLGEMPKDFEKLPS
jgi:hypothetical protein